MMMKLDAQGLPHLPHAVRLADYAAPDWLVPEVALDFQLGHDVTRVRSRLVVTRNGSHDRPLCLDGMHLRTTSVMIDGVPVNAAPTRLQGAAELLGLTIAGDRAVVEIEVDVVESVHKVVGRRGRLLAPVAGTGRFPSAAGSFPDMEAKIRFRTAPACVGEPNSNSSEATNVGPG